MPRLELTRIIAVLSVLVVLTGCATTSQPIAQAGSAKAGKVYYSEDTPQTGSHIARRYAVDDPNKPADKLGDNNSPNILVDTSLGGPKVAPRGN